MTTSASAAIEDSPASLARDLLLASRYEEPTEEIRTALARATEEDLAAVRTDHETALAFWLNCYNAGTQLLLDERPELYDSPLRFVRFFMTPALEVGGASISLDRIENGILRAGRSKYGLGYLPKLLVLTFEYRYRLRAVDPRIHFALNCGAESCPPIRAYEPDRVDDQLDVATRAYLETEVDFEMETDVVYVPRVFLWFRGDFGGRSGIRDFLRSYEVLPEAGSPTIRYQSWDWSKARGRFVE